MFNDEDFFLNDDELAEDNQLSMVDSARLDLLNSIIKSANDMIENLKFNEQTEANSNTRILAGYLDNLIALGNVDINGLSEEEVYEIIENVMKSTTELTFGNMNEIIPDENKNENMNSETHENDDGIDW